MTHATKRFLLVDDDPNYNFINKVLLKRSFNEVHIDDFTVPEEGLEFIKSETSPNSPNGKTILLLDINMPIISGWEFLKAFELFDASIKDQYNIYILSSSIDPSDMNRANSNPRVIDFLEKPLNKEILLKIFG
ncbi:response regulator [Cryomorpha ignava]|uniref:Response regulator n=1 Tax=Cryomorpha ignava TaxID=101383 RepID=A0A7K3WTP0_9FLAO|nr:response regulator [Cryomorpha ignava]NEN24391.1 response regulator [Cryomorpha ignava]